MGSRTTDSHIINSAERGLAVLRSMYRAGHGKQLAEVSAETGIDKAGVLRILATLIAEGIIRRDTTTGAYHPDMRSWINLVPSVQPALAFLAEVENALERLAELTRLSAGLILPFLDGRRNAPIMWSRAKTIMHFEPTHARPDAPLHASATGKCFLAAYSPAQLQDYLQSPLEKLTDRTITSRTKLLRELARVREQGYATQTGEHTDGLSTVAVPLLGFEGTPPAAITLVIPGYELNGYVDAWLTTLKETQQTISRLFSPTAWMELVRTKHVSDLLSLSPWDTPDPGFGDGPILHVRSVSRMIRMMAAIMRQPEGVSLREIARKRELDKTTAWRLLNTLMAGDVLWQDLPDQQFRISPRFWLRHAPILRAATSLMHLVSNLLEKLAIESGATAILTLPDREMRYNVMYQYALPHTPVRYHPEFVPPGPLHATAAGKAFLASQSHLTIQHYLKGGLLAMTPHSITSPEIFLEELAQVRTVGYAMNREELLEGVIACAVPVTEATGAVVGSLVLVATAFPKGASEPGPWLPLLQKAALALSPLLVGEWRGRLES